MVVADSIASLSSPWAGPPRAGGSPAAVMAWVSRGAEGPVGSLDPLARARPRPRWRAGPGSGPQVLQLVRELAALHQQRQAELAAAAQDQQLAAGAAALAAAAESSAK